MEVVQNVPPPNALAVLRCMNTAQYEWTWNNLCAVLFSVSLLIWLCEKSQSHAFFQQLWQEMALIAGTEEMETTCKVKLEGWLKKVMDVTECAQGNIS